MTSTEPRELIAPPPAPQARVYSLAVRPGLADCAPSGRARLDAIARWLQDVAFGDVEDAGLADAAVWVVRATRLRVTRFPRFAEPVQARTWCSGLGRMWAERRTTVTGADGGEVEAVSLWVHLDPAARRPSELTPRELEVYGPAAAGRRVKARLHHPGPSDGAAVRGTWIFRATDCDLADHVNNAAYWQILEEELLTGADPSGLDAELEYRSPTQPGEHRVLADGPMRWLLDPAGATSASFLVRL